MNIPLNIDWQQILLHLFNFTILFGVLYFLLYSPVKKFMESRQEYFKDMENRTKAELKNAEELKAEYQDKLKNADDEIVKLKKNAHSDVEQAAQLAIEQSKKDAEKLIKDAKANIERERNKMLSETRIEISDIVTKAVEKVVVNPDTALAYDAFLDAVKRGELNE